MVAPVNKSYYLITSKYFQVLTDRATQDSQSIYTGIIFHSYILLDHTFTNLPLLCIIYTGGKEWLTVPTADVAEFFPQLEVFIRKWTQLHSRRSHCVWAMDMAFFLICNN